MKQTKIWGTTQDIWKNNNVEIHRIEIVSGGYCSKHYHDYKFNMFFIENGKLKVDVWESENNEMNSTIISSKESTIVEPKLYHKFEALEPTIAYEIYWVQLLGDDIIRSNFGGKL